LVRKNRLVTLAGTGGIGKTRLATQVGHQLLPKYPDGVWLAALDSLSDPLHVPQTIATMFNIRESNDRPIMETVKSVLRGKSLLLVLDNCEHLLDACAQLISTLLAQCPNLRILTTSREILNVEGEATYYLPSLSTPEENTSLEELAKYESVQLFVERAALAQSHFQLTEENYQAIADICRRVDGIPLAIELTASRVNLLKVEDISKQIQKSFAILAADRRATLPRHQTLQASLDWSWSLLSNTEQTFMRQLSVFAGDWTLEAAQFVCGGNALNLINSLVQKSLVKVEHALEHATRYHFHEIIRQYARQKLLDAGEGNDVRSRHLIYFVNLVKQAEPELYRSNQIFWLNKLDRELDNLRTAFEWALATDAASGLRIATIPWRFWQRRNYLQEVETWLRQLLECYPKADSLRVEALAIYSHYIYLRGNTIKAWKIGEEALQLARDLGDQPNEAISLMFFARTVGCEGYHSQATSFFEQSLSLFKKSENKIGQATATGWMGFYHYDREQSKLFLLKSLKLHRELGNLSEIAWCLCQLSREAIYRGDFASPAAWLEEAKTKFQDLGAQGDEGDVSTYLGILAYWQCDYQQAHRYFDSAIILFEKSGLGDWAVWTHAWRGYVFLRQGDIVKAKETFESSLQLFQRDGGVIGLVFTIEGLACLYLKQGQPERATHLISWTDAMRERLGNPRPPVEQDDVNRIITASLAQIGEVAFSDAYDEGKKMSLEEAVAYALQT
jgi:predicted ATPase